MSMYKEKYCSISLPCLKGGGPRQRWRDTYFSYTPTACGGGIQKCRMQNEKCRAFFFHNFEFRIPNFELFTADCSTQWPKTFNLKIIRTQGANLEFVQITVSLHQAKLGPQRYCVAVMCPYRQGFVSLHRRPPVPLPLGKGGREYNIFLYTQT